MKEAFESINFHQKSRDLINEVNAVLERYRNQGYTLTLRQVYYQLVSRNIIPNSEKSYNNVGNLVSNGRLAGLIDWSMIVDRTRDVNIPPHWDTPADIIRASASQFRIDKWGNQPNHVMVMVEKQALEGILIPVCRELDIQFSANRGYSSSSAMYQIGLDFRNLRTTGKSIHILYLGDHDPSGIDMTRDVEDRLSQFSRGYVEVHRIALNMDQVEEFNLPENPAKMTDSRCQSYISEYGHSSWELDAIEPSVLASLVRDNVARFRDEYLFDDMIEREKRMRLHLSTLAEAFGQLEPEYYDKDRDEFSHIKLGEPGGSNFPEEFREDAF